MNQNEQTQNLEQLGQKGTMAAIHGLQLSHYLARLKQQPKNPFNANQPFIFSGQYTDLCFFLKEPHMAMSFIRDIEIPELRQAVCDNFDRAHQEGLILFNEEKGVISITEKGEEYINNPVFMQNARNDQSMAIAVHKEREAKLAQEAVIESAPTVVEPSEVYLELKGIDNDIAYFTHTDLLEKSAISHSKTIKAKFEEFESFGIIETVDEHYQITLKGKNLLEAAHYKMPGMTLDEVLPKNEVIDFTLRASAGDLEYFQHSNNLNLFALKSAHNAPNDALKPITDKIVANFNELQKAGIVTINENLNVKLTIKGKLLLENTEWQTQVEETLIAVHKEMESKLAKELTQETAPSISDGGFAQQQAEYQASLLADDAHLPQAPSELTIKITKPLETEAMKKLVAEQGVSALGDTTLCAATAGTGTVIVAAKKVADITKVVATAANVAQTISH